MENETIRLLREHVSVRRYTGEPVDEKTVETIVGCAQMAPSSCFYQAYSIIELRDKSKRAALAKISGDQACVINAPLVLVFLADLNRSAVYFENIDPVVLESAEAYTVAVVDAALAGQKALIAAQALGLGGVMVGGIRNDVAAAAAALELPDRVMPLFALCLGYPAERNGGKPRLPMRLVCKVDRYKQAQDDELIDAYNKTISAYYDARTNGREKSTWTSRSGESLMEQPRTSVGEYLRAHGLLKR